MQGNCFNLTLWMTLSLSGVLATFIILTYYPSILDPVMSRFSMAFDTYGKSGRLAEVVNRQGILDKVLPIVIHDISFMGNGMVSIVDHKTRMHFHNLYLTVLHQMGITGFLVFFGFISMLIQKLFFSWRNSLVKMDQLLAYSALLSLFILMLNSIKFEFNRSASYQQYVWVLFAIYYLIGKNVLEKVQDSVDS